MFRTKEQLLGPCRRWVEGINGYCSQKLLSKVQMLRSGQTRLDSFLDLLTASEDSSSLPHLPEHGDVHPYLHRFHEPKETQRSDHVSPKRRGLEIG